MVEKGINLFLLAVLPANVYMARKKLQLGDKEVPAWALWLRLPLQFVLIGLVKNYKIIARMLAMKLTSWLILYIYSAI